MSTLTKMALAAFAGLLLGGGALALAETSGNGSTVTETTSIEQPGDVSGPCDEAEHANDPRCNGQVGDREDNSGPGSANSGHGNSHDDDGDQEDNSGPGNSHDDGANDSHDDDADDDDSGSSHSGSGSGGSGSTHSGGSDDD